MEACDKAEGRYKWNKSEVKVWIAKGNILEQRQADFFVFMKYGHYSPVLSFTGHS